MNGTACGDAADIDGPSIVIVQCQVAIQRGIDVDRTRRQIRVYGDGASSLGCDGAAAQGAGDRCLSRACTVNGDVAVRGVDLFQTDAGSGHRAAGVDTSCRDSTGKTCVVKSNIAERVTDVGLATA